MTLVPVAMAEVPTDLGAMAAQINKECEAAEGAATQALIHAYAAGRALLTAQELVPPGKWMAWLEANVTASTSTAQRYMKFAEFRPAMEEAGVRSITEAIQMTMTAFQRPRPNRALWNSTRTDDAVRRIKECRQAGMTWNAIANEMGLSYATVRRWVDPVYDAKVSAVESARAKERARRRQEAARVERQLERDALARERKGRPANAYSLVRRCLAELDAALGEVEDAAARTALREAMRNCHRAEDFITAAMRGSAVADPAMRRARRLEGQSSDDN